MASQVLIQIEINHLVESQQLKKFHALKMIILASNMPNQKLLLKER